MGQLLCCAISNITNCRFLQSARSSHGGMRQPACSMAKNNCRTPYSCEAWRMGCAVPPIRIAAVAPNKNRCNANRKMPAPAALFPTFYGCVHPFFCGGRKRLVHRALSHKALFHPRKSCQGYDSSPYPVRSFCRSQEGRPTLHRLLSKRKNACASSPPRPFYAE